MASWGHCTADLPAYVPLNCGSEGRVFSASSRVHSGAIDSFSSNASKVTYKSVGRSPGRGRLFLYIRRIYVGAGVAFLYHFLIM